MRRAFFFLPPKDPRSLGQNRITQPQKSHRLFQRPGVLSEGWHPVCSKKELARKKIVARDFLDQRILVFRDAHGDVRALDAFCPHMGADLSNGAWIDGEIRCYFHRWRFDGKGELIETGCPSPELPQGVKIPSWPAGERYGWIWVYAGPEARHPIPSPPGFEDLPEAELDCVPFGPIDLFVHHHVMIASGIDLAHFRSVHGIDIEFDFETEEQDDGQVVWKLEGEIPPEGWKGKLGRWLLGNLFRYRLRVSGGGSVVAITYGWKQLFQGDGPKLPSLAVLWGCVPLENGLSRLQAFVVTHRNPGFRGWLEAKLRQALTFLLFAILKDEDIAAFPRMRFGTQRPTKEDQSVVRMIQWIDKQPISPWCPESSTPSKLEV